MHLMPHRFDGGQQHPSADVHTVQSYDRSQDGHGYRHEIVAV
jgi:hypothetical protein